MSVFLHIWCFQVPEVYWDMSSERVLTMEYCEGGKVDDREYMRTHNISVNEVSKGFLSSKMMVVVFCHRLSMVLSLT